MFYNYLTLSDDHFLYKQMVRAGRIIRIWIRIKITDFSDL